MIIVGQMYLHIGAQLVIGGSLIEYNDNLKYNYYVRLYNSKNNSFSKSKYPSILNEYISHSDKNVLFILNESWGSFDKKINNYILESIYKEKNYLKKLTMGNQILKE